MLIIFAVKVPPCKGCGNGYLFAPGFLVAQNWWLISILAGFVAVFTVVRWVLITLRCANTRVPARWEAR